MIASIVALSDSVLRRGTFSGIFWNQIGGIGVIVVNADCNWLDFKVAPGPDYRLYLAPKYVGT